MDEEIRYQGKTFTAREIDEIKEVIATNRKRSRLFISQEICRRWGWRQPNGVLQDMIFRGLLLRLEAQGLIEVSDQPDFFEGFYLVTPIMSQRSLLFLIWVTFNLSQFVAMRQNSKPFGNACVRLTPGRNSDIAQNRNKVSRMVLGEDPNIVCFKSGVR